ncbi:MAG TPA: hopanoid C-3 methylase HpnR [Myxococcales bacterium]|nr:hopanoid C-3 methylase HpnR [Myxococcales bacterium]
MKVLCIHPSRLLHARVFLRLEPLGLELVAAALCREGHEVRLVDLQVESYRELRAAARAFEPEVLFVSLNYLANVPEVIDLTVELRTAWPELFVVVGGHGASFIAEELLEHARGAIDCVVTGEGEEIAPRLLEALRDQRRGLHRLAGVVTLDGRGPKPALVRDLDALVPARELARRRRRYFIGTLDPAASIEFSRGCPYDCSFCSAWTFYGRAYRKRDPLRIGEELASVREPGIFLVDDLAFLDPEHGLAVGREIERRGIKKRYFVETRAEVLLRNREVFEYWRRLGLQCLFLGIEALEAQGLELFRERVGVDRSLEALEVARGLGVAVAINVIAGPDWDEARFRALREWAKSVPEIVHVSVATPYPGTELFGTDPDRFITRDYRLFDIQHAVTQTRLPLERFYEELLRTQQVLAHKHLGLDTLKATAGTAARLVARGQTNFVRMLWRFNHAYDARAHLADHRLPVRYALRLPSPLTCVAKREAPDPAPPDGPAA